MIQSPWGLPLRLAQLAVWFVWRFTVTSLQVSALILTPRRRARPGIVRVGLDQMSEAELTLLIAVITITPDTLVIAVDREARTMIVHGMFVDGDADAFRADLLSTQSRLLRGLRWRAPLPAAIDTSRGKDLS